MCFWPTTRAMGKGEIQDDAAGSNEGNRRGVSLIHCHDAIKITLLFVISHDVCHDSRGANDSVKSLDLDVSSFNV